MATWPIAPFPQEPLVAGYSSVKKSSVIRSSMGVGVDKVRRRVTANAYSISCTIMLTKAQVAELETFYNVTTNSGIDVFTWIHHIDDSAANYRFMDPPVYRNVSGNVWRAVLSLEIIP